MELTGTCGIAPSILSANQLALGEDLDSIATADVVHVDVMDGHFVPNVNFGPSLVAAVKQGTSLPVDVHLMVTNPDDTLGGYLDAGADYVSFHMEAARHAHRMVSQIKAAGAKAAVALNPGTSLASLDAILPDLDMVLLMTVDPGFGGQSFIDNCLPKIQELSHMCKARGLSPIIEVDGGIKASNIAQAAQAGATLFVAGSSVFGASDRAAAIQELRQLANDATTLHA